MTSYQEIIILRVADDQAVITYQDNLQMKRTSMRHLRLSKLQKEKMKQDKMWDFTVRVGELLTQMASKNFSVTMILRTCTHDPEVVSIPE